jgi:hypothetical protein
MARIHQFARSTTSEPSSPETPPHSMNSSKPYGWSSEHCVRLANKMQVLAIVNPRGMREVDELVDRLLAERR